MVWFLMSQKRSFGILACEEKGKFTDSPRDNLFNALFIIIIIGFAALMASLSYSIKKLLYPFFSSLTLRPQFAYYKKEGMHSKRFVKMHGAGNDFIIVEPQFFGLANSRSSVNTFSPEETSQIAHQAIALCKPHFGIGADGVLIVSEVEGRWKMSVFNSNGSFAPNCGNGLRCVVAYIFMTKNSGKKFVVATDSGDKEVEVVTSEGREHQVSLNLGSTSGVAELNLASSGHTHELFEKYLKSASIFQGGLGNSHFVIFLDNPSFKAIETSNAFEAIATQLVKITKANVNFCCIDARDSMRVITRQLGAGLTLACGTGSTTSAFVGHSIGKLDPVVSVHNRGGVLTITCERKEEGYDLHLKGPAKWVFSGEIDAKL